MLLHFGHEAPALKDKLIDFLSHPLSRVRRE
jgi:hypothetical protein